MLGTLEMLARFSRAAARGCIGEIERQLVADERKCCGARRLVLGQLLHITI